ncbi:Pentatricopeptide repeat-containing protein, mitochondrial, partial [Cucurbita argyrosperma subsp. sororia]
MQCTHPMCSTIFHREYASQSRLCSHHSAGNNGASVLELCKIVSCSIGGLDELEASLNRCTVSLTSSLVTRVMDSCKNEALTRRVGTGLWTTWLIPDRKFYFDLIGILCGAERASYALELFEKMKRSSLGGYSPVYDVLIPKLCRGGDFEMGRQLWEEAMAMGLKLGCSVRFSSQQERFIAKFLRNTTEAEKQNEAATDKTIAMGKRRDEVEERAVG